MFLECMCVVPSYIHQPHVLATSQIVCVHRLDVLLLPCSLLNIWYVVTYTRSSFHPIVLRSYVGSPYTQTQIYAMTLMKRTWNKQFIRACAIACSATRCFSLRCHRCSDAQGRDVHPCAHNTDGKYIVIAKQSRIEIVLIQS